MPMRLTAGPNTAEIDHDLDLMYARATRTIRAHHNLAGRCVICGGAFPCRTVILAADTLSR
jgi:hypothetical protein